VLKTLSMDGIPCLKEGDGIASCAVSEYDLSLVTPGLQTFTQLAWRLRLSLRSSQETA